MLGVMWGVALLNLLAGQRLLAFGIVPRSLDGLIGIPLCPFLHDGMAHLLANTVPLAVLGSLVVVRGRQGLGAVSAFIVLLGGVGVWLLARSSVHVGASGLVFGYFGYLVAGGWYDRSPSSVGLAVLVIFLYGGLIWGVLPSTPRVSWEGHLFGLLAGILLAKGGK